MVVGVGTAFHVYLPAYAEKRMLDAGQVSAGELPLGRGQTILLVEDQENLREAGEGCFHPSVTMW